MDLTELKRTITLCKESISSATQNLTKLTGRNYDKPLDSNRHFSNNTLSSRDNLMNSQKFAVKRRNSYEKENPVEIKRTRPEKEAPVLNSVVQMTKGRTRNDAICDLKTKENPKEKERCKRLFGHLMGTLNSIKKESEMSSNDPQQITRLKIEKKVEEDHKMISETIKREQDELLRAKKDRQFDLKNLNQRYRAAEAFERWRVEKEKMKGFVRTSKLPYIFYKPKIINDETQLRIDKTAREIDLLIETRKKKLEMEIERVVKRHLETTGNKDGDIDFSDIKIDEKLPESSSRKIISGRKSSREGSFASEDYDDMIEEIEITMHDEQVQIHDDDEEQQQQQLQQQDDERVVVNNNDNNNSNEEEDEVVNGDVVVLKKEEEEMEEQERIVIIKESTTTEEDVCPGEKMAQD